MITVFIGYDAREAIAYHVCSNSIIRHSTKPVSMIPLALNNLKDYSEMHTDGSNQFIYSRFLVPHLMNYQGWALFIDGDMLLRDDISILWDLIDPSKAVQCVHHSYKTKRNLKYLGSTNEDYPRKNWSSVVLWNCAHPKNAILTPGLIQASSGSFLHRFSWLSDDLIGELPIEWNWLPDELGINEDAKLLHYTLGTPCFHDFSVGGMTDEWHREQIYTTHCTQQQIG